MRIEFDHLFDRLGTADVGFSVVAELLTGREIELAGYLTPSADAARVVLTETPGDLAPVEPAPLAAVHLPGFRPARRRLPADRTVRVRGVLSFGFAVAEDGYASFLRLENARVVTGPRWR